MQNCCGRRWNGHTYTATPLSHFYERRVNLQLSQFVIERVLHDAMCGLARFPHLPESSPTTKTISHCQFHRKPTGIGGKASTTPGGGMYAAA